MSEILALPLKDDVEKTMKPNKEDYANGKTTSNEVNGTKKNGPIKSIASNEISKGNEPSKPQRPEVQPVQRPDEQILQNRNTVSGINKGGETGGTDTTNTDSIPTNEKPVLPTIKGPVRDTETTSKTG